MPNKVPIPIIILNWNGINDTIECLEAVLRMNYTSYMVYLVDNASKDDSQSILLEKYGKHPKIKLIFNQENLGFTKGNNVIMRQILAQPTLPEYIALLNNDTVVNPNWLGNLLDSAVRNQAAIVSSKMIDYYEPDKMDNAGHLMLNTGEIIPVGHGRPVGEYFESCENMGACAGAALYATQLLQEIGIFDEHFTMGYEDAELGLRAVVSGHKCWYEPSAIVYHKMGQSIKKIFSYEYSLSIQKHILYTYFKLMPTSVLLLAIPSFAIKYLAMFIINIVFWRPKYLKLVIQSVKETITKNCSTIINKRAAFFRQHKPIGSIHLIKKQTFFLWFDIERFYKYFILHKHSAFDVYGKSEEQISARIVNPKANQLQTISMFNTIAAYLPENNRLERIWKLAQVDFKSRYYNDVLGILWALIHPLFKLAIYYSVFTVLFKSSVENFSLYLFCGLLVWMFFTEGTNKGITLLAQKRYLIENIPFEKKDLFLSATLSVFFGFCFNFLAYFIMSFLLNVSFQATALFFPFLVLNVFIIVLAVAMILATISIYLKDIKNLWDMVVLTGFWATPIFWDQQMLFNSKLIVLLYLNPIAGLIVNMRQVLLYGEMPITFWLVYDVVFTVLLLLLALWVFDNYSHKAAEKL